MVSIKKGPPFLKYHSFFKSANFKLKIRKNLLRCIYFEDIMQRIGPELKVRLKQEIEVYVSKYPNASTIEIYDFLREGDHHPQLLSLKRNTMCKFIRFQARKYVSSGSALKHRGGNGRKRIPRRTESRIKRLLVKTPGSSLRNVAPKNGVSAQTVSNIITSHIIDGEHRHFWTLAS